MNKLKTRISVFSNNRGKAIAKAIEIIEISKESVLSGSFANVSNCMITTDNMIVRVFSANESSRGSKSHEIYIDENTEDELVNLVILPTLVERDSNSTIYKYSEHIHYF